MNLRLIKRAIAVAIIGLMALMLGAFSSIAPAGAATTGGYRYYQLDGGGCYDAAFYFDGSGRITQAWFDLNRDCRWETLARDVNTDGWFDEVWIDSVYGGDWEYLVAGNTIWIGPNQSGPYGCTPGPYGICWRTTGFTSTTISSVKTSGATAPAAFNNLMTSMARQSGIPIW